MMFGSKSIEKISKKRKDSTRISDKKERKLHKESRQRRQHRHDFLEFEE